VHWLDNKVFVNGDQCKGHAVTKNYIFYRICMYFPDRRHVCRRDSTHSEQVNCILLSIRICYCDEFSHFLFLCCCKSVKPVIPARKQALKDKKNEKSAAISNSTTDLTECHHFVFRRSSVELSINSLALELDI